MQEDKKAPGRLLARYLAVTAFCLIVSIIYSFFSHGIHSFWMRYLAIWPFVLGTIPAALEASGRLTFLSREDDEKTESPETKGFYQSKTQMFRDVYRFGIAAVTVSSFLKGVLEIAGTDSVYPGILLSAGAVMLLAAVLGLFLNPGKKESA